jgi:hypothetical protein
MSKNEIKTQTSTFPVIRRPESSIFICHNLSKSFYFFDSSTKADNVMKTIETVKIPAATFEPCTLLLDDASCITFTPLDEEGLDVIFNNTIMPYEVMLSERLVIAGCSGYASYD